MAVDPETIAFAGRLADAAGAAIRPHFRHRIEVTNKGAVYFDPVTEADKNAESAMRELLKRERPQDGILGEEFGEQESKNGFRWVLDPLDGTRAFICGRHEWGTLIGLEEKGKSILGILDQPVLGERFIGANGTSEMRVAGKTSPLKVRACAELSDAILCSTDPNSYFTIDERAAFARVSQSAKLTRFGGDCYVFAVLALGFVDLIIESRFNPWDIAALIPIIEGAGGIVTNWQGGPCAQGGQILAAGDKRVHQEAMRLLSKA